MNQRLRLVYSIAFSFMVLIKLSCGKLPFKCYFYNDGYNLVCISNKYLKPLTTNFKRMLY